MTNEQIQTAAAAAIRAMDDNTRAAFIKMFEAGERETTETVAQAYAIEGVSRQIRMASMCLESARTMEALTEVVAERIAA